MEERRMPMGEVRDILAGLRDESLGEMKHVGDHENVMVGSTVEEDGVLYLWIAPEGR